MYNSVIVFRIRGFQGESLSKNISETLYNSVILRRKTHNWLPVTKIRPSVIEQKRKHDIYTFIHKDFTFWHDIIHM